MMGQAREWWGASRRRRRRVTWLAALLVVAGSVASLVVWVRDTGSSAETPYVAGTPQVYHEPKQVHLPPSALHAAQVATFHFLQTAVLREHVEDSYALVAPSLRKGYTRKRWASGEIPVVPYPVDLKTVRYQLEYSYATGGPDGLPLIGIEVAMRPKAGENQPAMRFGIELEAAGTGSHRHWVVSQWGPRGQLGGEPQGFRGTAPPEPPKNGQLSTVWLLVPAVLLAGFIIVPLGFGLRSWSRNRRLARSFAASSEPTPPSQTTSD
jgi:hypothetical protein